MKEIRSNIDSEFRIAPASRRIEGYSILWNIESKDLGGFTEIIKPEAINGVLERSDILCLFNHDENKVLARNTMGKGTLKLKVDSKGLKYSLDAPKTPIGDECLDAIQRGDLRNSSFAFTVTQEGQTWEKRGDKHIRIITQFDKLWDQSPVFFPAYADTTAATRSLDAIKKEEMDMNKRQEVDITTETTTLAPVEDVEEKAEDVTTETTTLPPEEKADDEIVEAEMIEITYEGNIYLIPKDVLEKYVTEQDAERKLKEYYSEIEKSISQLKK